MALTIPTGLEEQQVHLNNRLAHLPAIRWREPRPGVSCCEAVFDSVELHIATFENALRF